MAQTTSITTKINKILFASAMVSGVFLSSFSLAGAVSTFITGQGGTGTTTPSGILYGDNGATTHLNTVVIGSGLTFAGGTLSNSASLNALGTTTPWTQGYLAYVASNSAVASVATSTLTPTSPLTGSFVQIGSGGSLGCQTASGSQAGCLSSTDWTTFNNKGSGTLTAVTGTWPIISSGGTTPNITWGGLASSSPISAGLLYATGVNTFASVSTSSPVSLNISGNAATATTLAGVLSSSLGGAGSVSGILKANGSGTVSAAVSGTDYAPATSGTSILKGNGSGGFSNASNGTDYTLLTATTCTSGDFVSALTASGGVTCSTPSGGGGSSSVATSTNETAGYIPYWTSTNATPALLGSIATSTPTIGTVLSYSGTLGNLIGGTSGTFSINNSAVTNAMLANSTISGISLGSNLNALTATNGTLTFSGSYNGSTARTVGLNLGNANTWTALQQFGNATSTLFGATKAWIPTITSLATTSVEAANGVDVGNGTHGIHVIPGTSTTTISFY